MGLVWLVVVAAIAMTALAARDYFTVREVRTPELTGLPIGEAGRLADEAGLTLSSFPVEAPGAGAETVVEQSPPAGSVVRRGRTVSVGVHVPAEADRMPALVGVSEADALAALDELSLPAPAIAYAYADGRSGRVIEQQPEAGRTVAPGEPVRLVVTRGPEPGRVELPDVVGLDLEAARAQLAALGVRRVEAVAVDVSMLRPGTVLQQRPEPGSVVLAGRPVTLGYALEGSEISQVPPVAGLEPWRARVALISAGFTLGPIEVVERPDEPSGVVEARPSGLTVAGAPVTLVINAPDREPVGIRGLRDPAERSGPVDPRDGIGGVDRSRDAGPLGEAGDGSRSVPFRFDPNELGVRSLIEHDYRLRLVVRDADGERTVLDRLVNAGETVRATVVVKGDEPLLQTYVNGVFFQAWRP